MNTAQLAATGRKQIREKLARDLNFAKGKRDFWALEVERLKEIAKQWSDAPEQGESEVRG